MKEHDWPAVCRACQSECDAAVQAVDTGPCSADFYKYKQCLPTPNFLEKTTNHTIQSTPNRPAAAMPQSRRQLRAARKQQHKAEGASETTLSPAQQVFGTAELLEHVLASASAATVVVARRIDKFSKNVVDNSPTLRKKLFLDKDESIQEETWAVSKDLDIIPCNNPKQYYDHCNVGARHLFNPVLFKAVTDENARLRRFHTWYAPRGNTIRMPAKKLEFTALPADITTIETRPSTVYCWDKFITQPPVVDITIEIRFKPLGGFRDYGTRTALGVFRHRGIRYGDLIHAIETETIRYGHSIVEGAFVNIWSPENRDVFASEEEMEMVAKGVWYAPQK